MYHISLLRSLVRCRATYSINIPRLWRSGIKEFANSIRPTESSQIIGIDCVELIWGLGAIHCLTQQQPAV